LCRTVVIGIQYNQYPAIGAALGGCQQQFAAEIVFLVQKAITTDANGRQRINIGFSRLPRIESPPQDRQGLNLAMSLHNTRTAHYRSTAPNKSDVSAFDCSSMLLRSGSS